MIQSAMMFALGVFVSGLIWLAFAVALVRRARRLTARRLLAGLATRRAEFETERDELRARHAVEMYRQEREVSRVLDMATAHRLEADVKERDLIALKAEFTAREEDIQDQQQRLATQNDQIQDLERRHAEAASGLRSAQHILKLEAKRRTIAEEALDEAIIIGDQRRIELSALRAQNDAMRDALGDSLAMESGEIALPRIPLLREPASAPLTPAPAPAQKSSVVPLTRIRPLPGDAGEQSIALVTEATRDLQRLAGDGHGDVATVASRQPAHLEPRMPTATVPGEPSVADLVARRIASNGAAAGKSDAQGDAEENAETRFFEALAEIRALKRSAGQAGE